MKNVVLGSTGITVPQNGFGCLPIQRVSFETAAELLRKAYAAGVTFFDTARAYTDSEEKVGKAFEGIDRSTYYLATKTQAKDVKTFWEHLETSLKLLKTDYIDIYQFHQADKVYRPNDGTGMYEAMLEAKEKGLIRHIGITTHKLSIAREIIESGLYETLQYPFSYLSNDAEAQLVRDCASHNMGFIGMKGLCGGLLTNSKACMAYITQFDNAVPIWGIQRDSELNEWLSYMENTPCMDEENTSFITEDRKTIGGDFCRSCGYCMPCPQGINIPQCARMSQLLRRMPSDNWLSEEWQNEMKKIETCLHCGQCASRCPYSLNTPELLAKNYEDYKKVIAGEVKVK